MGRWKNKYNNKTTDKDSFMPLTMTPSFSRNGSLIIKSNQKMVIPPFEADQPASVSAKRSLIPMSEVDVTRDLFAIEFDFYAS